MNFQRIKTIRDICFESRTFVIEWEDRKITEVCLRTLTDQATEDEFFSLTHDGEMIYIPLFRTRLVLPSGLVYYRPIEIHASTLRGS